MVPKMSSRKQLPTILSTIGLVWNDSKTKRTCLGLLKLKGLVWDFWNLKDHFGKNEKLKAPLDAFDQNT